MLILQVGTVPQLERGYDLRADPHEGQTIKSLEIGYQLVKRALPAENVFESFVDREFSVGTHTC